MKKLLALVLAAVMAFSMVACGGGSEAETTPDGPVTIDFWHSMGGATGELVDEIVKEFNSSQDEVIVNVIYQGDYNAAGAKLQAALSGSGESAPHVAQIEITRVGFYAEEGLLVDLKPYDDLILFRTTGFFAIVTSF